MKDLELRTSQRVTVNLLAGQTTGGKYFVPLLANLSERGAYVESPTGLDIPSSGASVLELALPGVPGLIWARCKVIREKKHGMFLGQALQFVNISAVDRKSIRLYLQRCVGQA